jgi:aspartate/methionine/tyrosine aminotransferase
LRADKLVRSPIRTIMELADRDNIVALGLDPDDVISFAGGWVDHAAPAAMRAAYERIAADAAGFHDSGAYSPTAGLPRLRETLARVDAEIWGRDGLSIDNVIVGQSSTQLTYCLFTALLEPGDKVLLFDPAYANYGPQLGVLDDRVEVISLPVLDVESWSYFGDAAAILTRLEELLRQQRPKLLLFSSPDNPTGQIVPDDVFDDIVVLAARHGCLVAVDYAYRAQYFGERPPRHFAAGPARHENLIAIHSNSKWCRGLGRRLGWVVARPDIVSALALVQQSVILCPDTLHQTALAEYLDTALDDGSLRRYLEDSRRAYARAARHMCACIERYLDMRFLEPQGGLYTVVEVGDDGDAFVHEILGATGVIFVPGSGFGATLAGAVRISFGPLVNAPDLMEEGFARVRRHLAG